MAYIANIYFPGDPMNEIFTSVPNDDVMISPYVESDYYIDLILVTPGSTDFDPPDYTYGRMYFNFTGRDPATDTVCFRGRDAQTIEGETRYEGYNQPGIWNSFNFGDPSVPYAFVSAHWSSSSQAWSAGSWSTHWDTSSWNWIHAGSPYSNLHIIKSTCKIAFEGMGAYDPTAPQEFYFDNDNFTLHFGSLTTRNSNEWTGNQPDSPIGRTNDINRYWYTDSFIPVIRFTSPDTGLDYSVDVRQLPEFEEAGGFTLNVPWFDITDVNAEPILYSLYYKTQQDPYVAGYAALQGGWDQTDLMDYTYDEATVLPTDQTVTVAHLLEYFQKLNPSFTPNDLYTEVYMDFCAYQGADQPAGSVVGTKMVDLTYLHDTGIDPGDYEGGGGYTGYENNDTNPDYNPDPTNIINLINPTLTPYNLFNRTYILTGTQVKELSDLLSTVDDSKIEAMLEGLQLFGANPIDAIIDLRLYPFDVASVPGSSVLATEEIMIGRQASGITAPIMKGNSAIIKLGGMYIQPKFYSFLDYEPYTVIRLYIPYIGTIELPPSLYMEKTVSVNLIVDYITGAATAVIFANGIPMTYQSGVIGTSIAVTGDNASAYTNGIIGNLIGAAGSAAGAVVSGITGNIPAALSKGLSAAEDLVNMGQSVNEAQFQQAGAASPSTNNWLPQKCHIMIARPQPVFKNPGDNDRYGLQVGYATAYTDFIGALSNASGIFYGKMSEFTGASANEPTPTAKEVDMLKQTLNTGFFTH